MKRLLYGMAGIAVLLVMLAAAAVWYVRPERELDMTYSEISAFSKIVDMVARRQPVLELNEKDIENLVKRSLSEQTRLSKHMTMTGARIMQQGNRLDADVTVLLYGKIPAGIHLQYVLSAEGARLTARFQAARIRGITLPQGSLNVPDVIVDVNSRIPAGMIGVKQLEFGDHDVRVHLGLR